MRTVASITAGIVLLLASGAIMAQDSPGLKPPVKIEVDGKPIEVEAVGHACPFVGDIDDDGKDDLLVGQMGPGKMRIFRNTGSPGSPQLSAPEWFQAGGVDGRVPTG